MIMLALGSNAGHRARNIREGLRILKESGVSVLRVSSFYRSQPAEGVGGGYFLNAAAVIDTALSPEDLLDLLHRVETALGRPYPRAKKNEARTLDMDILYYGEEVIRRPGLQVPHPRRSRRAFVLRPAAEIAPDFHDPVLKKTLRELCDTGPF